MHDFFKDHPLVRAPRAWTAKCSGGACSRGTVSKDKGMAMRSKTSGSKPWWWSSAPLNDQPASSRAGDDNQDHANLPRPRRHHANVGNAHADSRDQQGDNGVTMMIWLLVALSLGCSALMGLAVH